MGIYKPDCSPAQDKSLSEFDPSPAIPDISPVITPLGVAKPYMNLEEVAAYIGRSVRTVRTYIRRHGFPFGRVGAHGALFFRQVDVDAWMARQVKQTGGGPPACPNA